MCPWDDIWFSLLFWLWCTFDNRTLKKHYHSFIKIHITTDWQKNDVKAYFQRTVIVSSSSRYLINPSNVCLQRRWTCARWGWCPLHLEQVWWGKRGKGLIAFVLLISQGAFKWIKLLFHHTNKFGPCHFRCDNNKPQRSANIGTFQFLDLYSRN